jgi:hypothetical protein
MPNIKNATKTTKPDTQYYNKNGEPVQVSSIERNLNDGTVEQIWFDAKGKPTVQLVTTESAGRHYNITLHKTEYWPGSGMVRIHTNYIQGYRTEYDSKGNLLRQITLPDGLVQTYHQGPGERQRYDVPTAKPVVERWDGRQGRWVGADEVKPATAKPATTKPAKAKAKPAKAKAPRFRTVDDSDDSYRTR